MCCVKVRFQFQQKLGELEPLPELLKVCQCVCLSVHPSVCLSVCPSICLSVYQDIIRRASKENGHAAVTREE